MSFREKTAAASIVAIVLVYGFYAFKLLHAPLLPFVAVTALIGSTILIILVQIVAQVVIGVAAKSRPEAIDERDRLVGLRSLRNAYYVFSAFAWGVAMLALISPPPVLLTYVLIGGFGVADVVRNASQLVYYRFGL